MTFLREKGWCFQAPAEMVSDAAVPALFYWLKGYTFARTPVQVTDPPGPARGTP
jgi:hypothetical protein